MQSISRAQNASLTNSPISQPLSPKSISKSESSTPTRFFAFRWIFRNSRNSSAKKKLKGFREKSTEKFSTFVDTTTILYRQSYSFDDVQQFLLTREQNQTQQNKLNIYKSNLDIACSNSKTTKTKLLNTFTCKLCLTTKPSYEMHSIWSCGCPFCKSCLSQYCEVAISEAKVSTLNCPDGSCQYTISKENQLSPREVKLLVSKESYETYERFRLNWVVENDPNKMWCPTPNCENICYITANHKHKNKSVPIYCPKCNKSFCSSCRSNWHSGIDCKKFNLQEDFLLNEMSSIKRCPKCCILIERDEGCAQIMCRNCKHVFCWFCLASLEDDFLLRHYDSGPCKNKLGHSRASVIWHRTQVIGIFAGFGILILLASPMFILAAPCLLCCKCNSWYKNEDHDEYDDLSPNTSDVNRNVSIL